MIEFDEKNHIYIKNGIVLKSVTQILKELFPNKYENIPDKILNSKSEYGTKLHKCIEIIEKKKPKRPISYCKRYLKINIYQEQSLKDYLEIKKQYNIEVLESEKIVSYDYDYAGTLDMIALVNDKKSIIDIKTTYEFDEMYVSYQNSLYELANGKVDKLYCLWLPKRKIGKLIEVKRINKDILLEIIK